MDAGSFFCFPEIPEGILRMKATAAEAPLQNNNHCRIRNAKGKPAALVRGGRFALAESRATDYLLEN